MPCGLLGQHFIRKPVFMNNTPAKLLTGLRVIGKKKNIRRIFLLSTVCYLLLYLLAISDLSFHSSPRSFAMVWSPQPFSILFKPISPFYFEAIALLELPFLTFLLSPINLLIGFALSLLVGVNIAFSYFAFTQPQVCHGKPTAGILASLPALLAGSACCGPLILIAFGIQASAALIAFFGWLIPMAVLLLVGALLFNGRRMNFYYLESLQ
jgi:hypothetical protein